MKKEEPVKITIIEGGPMIVNGVFTVMGADSKPIVFTPAQMEAGIALCICGKSQATPMCDGSHVKR